MTISQGVLKQKILQARRHSCHLTNSVKTHKAIKKTRSPDVAEIANYTAYDVRYIATDYSTDCVVRREHVGLSFNNNNTP